MTTPGSRKAAVDHVAEALMHLEKAEAALGRVDDSRVNATARAAIERMRRAVLDGRNASADSIEALLTGGLGRDVAGNGAPAKRTARKKV